MFFRTRFQDMLYWILGGIFEQIGAQMGAKLDERIYENLSRFFDKILMDFEGPKREVPGGSGWFLTRFGGLGTTVPQIARPQ